MKTNTKRLLSMIMALAMILSLLPVMASAAETKTLYFNPGPWNVDGAWFDAWRWGGTTDDSWVTFTDTNGDGIFEGEIPTDNTGIIFLRKDPASSAHDWNCWNRVDPTYDNSKNCFSVTGWGSSDYSWSTVVVPEWNSPIVEGDSVTFNYWSSDKLTSVEVRGIDAQDISWSAGLAMTQDAETGIWSATLSGLYNGTYEYKFVTNGTNWINDLKNTGTQFGGNNTFTITDGVVDSNEPEYTSPVISGTSVTFNYWQADEFTTATVYGDMSDDGWATAYPMVKNEETGVWSVTVEVPYNGTYEYKIVVDKAWLKDPKNDNIADSGNSYFAITEGTEPEPELPVDPIGYPEIVYLLPNFNWGGDYATFAAYFFNADGESEWVSMTDGNVDGVYEAYVPEGMTSVIFCRMNPEASEPSWESKWNQSADLAIPTDGTDLYIPVQNTWDQSDTTTPWNGEWVTYTEVAVPEFTSPVVDGNSVTIKYWRYAASSVSVRGSMSDDNWSTEYAMTKGEDGAWSVTINDLPDGMYTYKLVVDDCWITDPNNVDVQVEADGNQNSLFVVGEPIIQIWNVGYFFSFEEAYAASDPDRGDSITLLADVTVNDLVVDKEMYLDLNGHNLTINAASAEAMIWVQDSATVDPSVTQWGTLIVNGADYEALGGYVMLPEAEGYSFHNYEIQITHVSLKPANDALGYKATVTGDSAVMNAVTGFGFNMGVADGEIRTFTKDAEEDFDGTFTLRLQNILACGGGEMEITASAFVIFGEEKTWDSEAQTTTMKETLQAVDAAWETAGYNAEQKAAVQALCTEFYGIIQDWNLDNIFPTIDIPIESVA